MSQQSHPSSAFREPAGSGGVPSVLAGVMVNAPVPMAFEWNWGDPLPAGLVFTGDANRTKIDANGIVRTVAANVPRNDGYVFDKNGVLQPAWLLEDAAINGVAYSEQFDNAAWFKNTGISVTANTATAPDGNATADTIADSSAADLSAIYQNAAIPNDSNPVTASAWLKAGTSHIAAIEVAVFGGTFKAGFVVVDLNTGTFLGTSAFTRVSVTPFPNGWYRVSVTVTNNSSGNTSAQLAMFPAYASTLSATGDVTSTGTIYAWGAQLETGPCPTSYIQTTSASVLRVAEIAYVPWVYKPQAMVVDTKFVECGTILRSIGGIFTVGNPGAPAFALYAAGHYIDEHFTVPGQVAAAGSTPVIGDVVDSRALLYSDGSVQLGQSINGAAEVVSSRTTALAFAPQWSSPIFCLNGDGSVVNRGFTAFQSIRIALGGPWTLRQMQKLDGDPTVHTFAPTGTPVGSLVSTGARSYQASTTDLTGTGRVAFIGGTKKGALI